MTEFIGNILSGFSAGFINGTVLLSMVAVFISAVLLSKKNRAIEFVQYTPTLLTTLGIFGTFFGIVLGLLHFEPTDVEGSVQFLLDGLKTAFITSLAGMFCSLVFKILQTTPFLQCPDEEKDPEFMLFESILAAIETQVEEIRSLKRAIVGDRDSSLFGIVKMLRHDMNENSILSSTKTQEQLALLSDKLRVDLDGFAEILSSSATAQVVDALKQVVVNFNYQLTEQFGDNFTHLNHAVKGLLVWQENYKTQLETMSEQYAKGVQAISETELSVTKIGKQSRIIYENMEALKQVMTVNQHQLAELERHLEAFKDIRDKAVEAVPEIRRQVEYTVSEISAAVSIANTHYKQLLDNSDVFIQQHAKTTEDLLCKFANSTEDSIEKVGQRLESSAKRIGKDIENAGALFTQSTERSNESMQDVSKYLQSQTELMSNQLQEMVTGLNGQVHEILDNLVGGAKTLNETMTDANSDLITDTKNVRDQVIEAIDSMQAQLKDVIEHVASEQHRLSISTFKSLEKKIANQVARTGEVVEKQVGLLDKAMQEEINNAFSDMGTQLVSLTGRFTEDYSKLTEQMQNVVNRASGF